MAAREEAEVVVVGAGAVGLATAHALARAGRDVLVLEQFEVGHARGSSHGSSRIFRLAYDELSWVRLAQQALPLWRELEAEAGVELLSLSGSLDTGRDVEPLCSALAECGADFDVLEPAKVEQRFGVRLRGPAVLQPQGGVAWAARTIAALRGSLNVVEETRALGLEERAGRVVVRTSRGPVEAGAAVVCAGAWARPLLETAGYELAVTVTRETVSFFSLAGGATVPSVIDWGMAEGWPGVQVYALDAGGGLLKIGLHHGGVEADPGADGASDEAVVGFACEWANAAFRLAGAEPVASETCLYTTTADESFVLDRRGRIVVGSACSGHAFKFVPAVGARLARLTEEALTS
jgi:sarcosine oxidase